MARIAAIFREHPLLGSIGACCGPEYFGGVELPMHGMLRTGHANPRKASHRFFADLPNQRRHQLWSRDEIAHMLRCDRILRRLDGDPRIQPLIKAMRSTSPGFQTWIRRGDDPIAERSVCKEINRPDIWARIEARQIASLAGDGRPLGGPARI